MNTQTAKPALDRGEITVRLYQIRNIANLMALCPEGKAEVYVLQDVVGHVSDMIQALIEDIDN
jgi:hypothetical protein